MSKQSRTLLCSLELGCLLLLCILALSACSHAEDLPDAPHAIVKSQVKPIHQPWMTKTEMADAGGVIFVNMLDWYTTEKFLSLGGKEAILPNELVQSSGGFLSFKLGVSAGQIIGEHYVDRMPYLRRHAWIRYSAQTGQRVAIAMILRTDIGNIHYISRLQIPSPNPSPSSPVSAPLKFHLGGKR